MHLDVTAAIAVIAVFWFGTLWLLGNEKNASLDNEEAIVLNEEKLDA